MAQAGFFLRGLLPRSRNHGRPRGIATFFEGVDFADFGVINYGLTPDDAMPVVQAGPLP